MRAQNTPRATNPDATVKPLGQLKPQVNTENLVSDYDQKLTEIEDRKASIARQNADAANEMADLLRQEQEAFEQKQQARRQERNALLEQASYYRELAKECDDKERTDELIRWAVTAEQDARRIIIEGDTEPLPAQLEAGREEPYFLQSGFWVGLVSTAGLIGILFAAVDYFDMFREMILTANRSLPPDQQMSPYDLTSFQKLAFEKLVQFSDLPIALIMLLLVMPRVAIYVLPFTRTKPDFWYEFKHELTPWQRCALATCFVVAFLFLAVLVHLVKL